MTAGYESLAEELAGGKEEYEQQKEAELKKQKDKRRHITVMGDTKSGHYYDGASGTWKWQD